MQTDTAFKPFVPPAPMFEEGKPPAAAKPDKPKPNRTRNRKPRSPKAAKPAPMRGRPVRKKKTAAKKVRKKRTRRTNVPATNHRAPAVRRVQKVDLDTALQIGAMLKANDLAMFTAIRQHLGAVNKATRKRLLSAITKVFG